MRGFFTVYLALVLPALAINQESSKQVCDSYSLAKKEREYIPTHIRVKRMCGIPDSIKWSYKTKVVYSERILAVIDSIDNNLKK